MALSDALKFETSKRPGPRCTLCVARASLPKSDQTALDGALTDLSVTSAAIARALVSEGHDIRSETVRRHRSHECSGL